MVMQLLVSGYNTPFHVTLFPPLYRAAFMENNVEDVGAQQ